MSIIIGQIFLTLLLVSRCRLRHVGKVWNPIDYGNTKRTLEKSGKTCALRCEMTSSCIGYSWWDDGSCHLATNEAKLTDIGIVTYSFPCRIKGEDYVQICVGLNIFMCKV